MSKTKTLSITSSEEVRISAYHGKSTVHVDNPEIEDMLKEVAWEDIVAYIQGENTTPDEVFEEKDLDKWAEDHGYVKG